MAIAAAPKPNPNPKPNPTPTNIDAAWRASLPAPDAARLIDIVSVRTLMGSAAAGPAPLWRQCCPRHLSERVEHHYGRWSAPFLSYWDEAGILRLCQVVRFATGRSDDAAPPGSVCVIYRPFAGPRHYEYMSHRARATRAQLQQWSAELVMDCRDCCLCRAILLFELLSPDISLRRETPSSARAAGAAMCSGIDDDISAAIDPRNELLCASGQFSAMGAAEQCAALLWFFGGVNRPLQKFWMCVGDAYRNHAVAGVPANVHDAVCQVQDEAMRLYVLASQSTYTEAYYETIRDNMAMPMLNSGLLYVHMKREQLALKWYGARPSSPPI